jgi:hypothetical protein
MSASKSSELDSEPPCTAVARADGIIKVYI